MDTLALLPARLVDPLFLVLVVAAVGGALALRPLRSAGARARRGGWAMAFAWALLWLGGTPAVAAALTRALEAPPADEAIAAALRDVDPERVAMVVLGGGMREGPPGVPPLERLHGGSAPRAIGAARIWQAHRCGTVVVSGASGEAPRDEMAAGMRDLMVALGVPREIILLEPEAINTRQNATLSMELLRARGAFDRVVVVTTARHMSRSLADFRRAGVEAIGAPVDHQGFAPPGLFGWLPSTSGLWLTGKAVHEMLGRLKP
ncbi:MAG: YdcF family protein [Polyangiaceae bacterium]